MTDIISLKTIEHLKKSLKEDVFSSLINIYIADTQKYVFELIQCLQQNNPQEAYRLAHTVKGSSANMGAQALQEILGNIEAYCKKGNLIEAKNHIKNILSISQQTLTEMRRFGP